jgi:uncharacterized membrane protein
MLDPRLLLASVLLLLGPAATVSAGRPDLVCRGHDPSWSLRIEGGRATLATLGTGGIVQSGLEGRLLDLDWARPPFLVYRGRAQASSADLVAVVTRESCADTMADAAEGGGALEFTARVSFPEGDARVGCCTRAAAETPPAPAAAAAPGRPGPGGEIVAVELSDGTLCRSTGKGAAPVFDGQRLNFDCGQAGVDRVGLLGPLEGAPGGLLGARRAEIEWNEGLSSVRRSQLAPARAVEIALADGPTCRFAGEGATLAFDGRRASYTCGTGDGDTVALLGDLEPAEGGFRIVRARLHHGDGGFVLRSSETILVTAPR